MGGQIWKEKSSRLQFRRTELYLRVWLCCEPLDWFHLSVRSSTRKEQGRVGARPCPREVVGRSLSQVAQSVDKWQLTHASFKWTLRLPDTCSLPSLYF